MLDPDAITDSASFKSLMVDFHKMVDYFGLDSEILYETEIIRISLKGNAFAVALKNQKAYHREKICYVPSERNSAVLPELQGFEFGQTNLKSFLFDWFNAREFYKEDNKTTILDLGVKYFYDPNELKYKDRIEHVNGQTYQIPLGGASSGLQSLVPLQIMIQYYSERYFETYDAKTSFDSDAKQQAIRRKLTDMVVLKELFKDEYSFENRSQLIKQANELLHNNDLEAKKLLDIYREEVTRLTVPVHTLFIVEEPEQNLYPSTQMELLETIVNLCSGERQHGCTITTHSPFILNYLNVLITRYYKGLHGKAVLNPNELSVFATGDGRLTDLMQENTITHEKSVNAEDLVEAMRHMHTEYLELKGM